MKQKSRVPKPRKPTLAHMVSDLVRLLKAMENLERLREKVRLAESNQRPRLPDAVSASRQGTDTIAKILPP
ncbi:hypothetical protein ACVWYQ_000958 [Bradyrhizobium sp. USDA 3397]